MDAQKLIELQNRIVAATADALNSKWDIAVVNIEIDDVDGEQSENCLALFFEFQQGTWERHSFQIPYECYDLFSILRNSCNEQKWTACTLEFDSSGKYEFNYSYDGARRLHGIYDHETMLKGYSPTPFTE